MRPTTRKGHAKAAVAHYKPMSKLDSDGRRLLNYLVSGLPHIDPDYLKTLFTYKQVHTALNLDRLGSTYGTSLQRQGLNSLGAWAISNKKPAITGLIIEATTIQPGDGFFLAYHKKNADYAWWVDQIRQVKQYDWSGDLKCRRLRGPAQ